METIKLLSIAALIFTAYVCYIWFKYGVQKSISASYFKLVGWRKVFFTLTLWSFSILVMMSVENGLIFFAGSAIYFVGASPIITSNLAKKVHYTGAISGIILGLLALVISFGQWILVMNVCYIGIIIWCKSKKWMWWVEILVFYGIVGGLLIWKLWI